MGLFKMDILDAKRYTINAFGDKYYITISYTIDGDPCEIFTNFPPECKIGEWEKLLIDGLKRSWTMLLNNGISMRDIIQQSLPYSGCTDMFINDLVHILSYNIHGELP